MLTPVRRLCGHRSTGPNGVVDQSNARISAPMSPPPARQSRAIVGLIDVGGVSRMVGGFGEYTRQDGDPSPTVKDGTYLMPDDSKSLTRRSVGPTPDLGSDLGSDHWSDTWSDTWSDPRSDPCLELEQTRDLDDETAVLDVGNASRQRGSAVAVDDEQLAAGLVFPAKTRVGGDGVGARLVLHQAGDEHPRRQRVGEAAAHQVRVAAPPRHVHVVDGNRRLGIEPRREFDAAAPAHLGHGAVVEAAVHSC